MSETKSEKFQRLRDTRLPKITHALGILANLGGSAYESTIQERQDILDALDAAVDQVAKAFGLEDEQPAAIDTAVSQALTPPVRATELTSDKAPPEKPTQVATAQEDDQGPSGSPRSSDPSGSPPTQSDTISPHFVAAGGGLAIHEIMWAHDMVGKDNKLARNRLRRIIDAYKRT